MKIFRKIKEEETGKEFNLYIIEERENYYPNAEDGSIFTQMRLGYIDDKTKEMFFVSPSWTKEENIDKMIKRQQRRVFMFGEAAHSEIG